VNLDQIVGVLLGGGILGTIVTWLTTKHRPKVDTAQVVITGQGNFIDDLRESVKAEREEKDKQRARADACEETLRQERARWDTKEREFQARHDDHQRQIGALGAQLDAAIGHLWVIETGLNQGTIPPLPGPPYLIDHLVKRAHKENPATVRDDNGVPGTETNPPPPDDGLDLPPQE